MEMGEDGSFVLTNHSPIL